MSIEKFTEFLNGFFAANQLMNRAGRQGCFVEYVCLATSVIDGFLRVGLVLQHQLDKCTREIPIELIFQSDRDNIITERDIYRKALKGGIISKPEFDHIEAIYFKRNKIVHRYIISEITTDDVLQIAVEYHKLIEVIGKKIRILEDKQIEKGVGMTVSEKLVPDVLHMNANQLIQEMADEKHVHPILAQNLKSTGKKLGK